MTDDISPNEFRSMDAVKALKTYVDAIELLQELKRIERALVDYFLFTAKG